MRHVLKSLGVAAGLALVLAACGIKGAPKPPLPAPVPSTETQSPSEDPGRSPIEPSGPTITPGQDAGTVVPDTVVPDTVVPPDTETP